MAAEPIPDTLRAPLPAIELSPVHHNRGPAGVGGERTMSDWPDDRASADREIEPLRKELAHLRTELRATRILVYGFLVVLVLAHSGSAGGAPAPARPR